MHILWHIEKAQFVLVKSKCNFRCGFDSVHFSLPSLSEINLQNLISIYDNDGPLLPKL